MGQAGKTISYNIEDVVKSKSLKETRLQSILKASNVINSKLELNYVLKQVIRYATKLTNSVAASIIMSSESSDDLVIAYPTGPTADSISDIKFPRTKGIAGSCISTGQIKVVHDAKTNPSHFVKIDNSTGFKTESILCVPLSIKGNTIGCLELINKRDGTRFDDDDIAVATIMSNLAAISIKNAEAYEKLQKVNIVLKSQLPSIDLVIGRNHKVRKTFEIIKKLKDNKSTVLILGESGTGKGVLARFIHEQSTRKEHPFVTVSCSVFSQALLESELFGHEKGAFTGADRLKKGRFELAGEGTIFLDEIGEMDKAIQTKLLKVLQEKTYERVGGTETLLTDARIIAATNVNLEEAVEENLFRKDLYYRLKVIVILLPPLRERKEDIPAFAKSFLEKYSNELNKSVHTFDNESMSTLQSYDYPGNIRELENIVERAVVLSEDNVIHLSDLPDDIRYEKPQRSDLAASPEKTKSFIEMEKELILKTLDQCSWNQSMASRLLGITRNKLRYRVKMYNLTRH